MVVVGAGVGVVLALAVDVGLDFLVAVGLVVADDVLDVLDAVLDTLVALGSGLAAPDAVALVVGFGARFVARTARSRTVAVIRAIRRGPGEFVRTVTRSAPVRERTQRPKEPGHGRAQVRPTKRV